MSSKLEAVAAEATRLDKFLGGQFVDVSRARFQKLIAEGCVAVEGVVVLDGGTKLKIGQRVVVDVPEAAPPSPLPAIPVAPAN